MMVNFVCVNKLKGPIREKCETSSTVGAILDILYYYLGIHIPEVVG
jgi:hypothetical protein